jgi:HlyD family secretion protein
VDTRPIKIAGRVTRIDPAATAGQVTVDIALEEKVPQGVYADQAVDAVITIESLEGVMYVSRPINVQQNQKAGMFKVVDNGTAAVRVVIEFGRSSVDKIEIVLGAEVGDELILSDMSRWDEYDRVRIRR